MRNSGMKTNQIEKTMEFKMKIKLRECEQKVKARAKI
jgi:hypothetical protein